MSSLPTPPPKAPRVDHLGAAWPGLIPLRPLGISEILSAAVTVVRSRALILCGLAGAFGLISGGASIALLSALPDSTAYFSAEWIEEVAAGTSMSIPAAVLWPTLVATVIGLFGTAVISGLATVTVTEAALGRTADAAAFRRRLGGSTGTVLAISAIFAVLVIAGFMALIVPGVLLYLGLLMAVPAAVMERLSPAAAMKRSYRLSRGLLLRMFAAVAVSAIVISLIDALVSAALPLPTEISDLYLTLAVSALISAVTTPWTAAVMALLYVDARLRKENLAATLQRAAGV